MLKKIAAVAVVIILVVVAIGIPTQSSSGGGEVTHDDGSVTGSNEMEIVLRKQDSDDSLSLSLSIPADVSMLQSFLKNAGAAKLSTNTLSVSASDKKWDPETPVEFHGIASSYWSGEDIQSVDNLTIEQYGYAGTKLTDSNDNYDITGKKTDLPLEVSKDDPVKIGPDEYFSHNDGEPILAKEVDGAELKTYVEISSTDNNGNTITDKVTIHTTLTLEFETEGSLSLSAELTDVSTEAQ